MATTTIAVLFPGAMGAALASVLRRRNPALKLLTSLEGRSPETFTRAASVPLQVVPLAQSVSEADIILSILPPSSAISLARDVSALLVEHPRARPPVYVDANALAPATMDEIAGILGDSVPLIDACVIGLPPREKDDYEPTIYLAADARWQAQLKEAAAVLGGPNGWRSVKTLNDAGAGAASALKMCYGGLAKGTIGLAALLVLTANAHSPGTARALLDEMGSSSQDMLSRLGFAFHDMPPKAYRWVGEMEEISSFVSASLGSEAAGNVHSGLAAVFERIAADLRATGEATGAAAKGPEGDAEEVRVLHAFADESKALLEEKGYKRK